MSVFLLWDQSLDFNKMSKLALRTVKQVNIFNKMFTPVISPFLLWDQSKIYNKMSKRSPSLCKPDFVFNRLDIRNSSKLYYTTRSINIRHHIAAEIKCPLLFTHTEGLNYKYMQSSQWVPVLWPKTSKMFFGLVNFSVFI